MTYVSSHGSATALEAFNSGNFAPVVDLMRDAVSANESRQAAGIAATLAALMRLAQVVEVARGSGYRFNPEPPTANDLMYRASIGGERFFEGARLVIAAAIELRRVAPALRLADAEPAAIQAESVDTPVATPSAPPQPIEVRVVSMPARQTASQIERDGEGNIVRTTMIESDF